MLAGPLIGLCTWRQIVSPTRNAPSNPQAYNRYAYVLNNPLRFTDPTGHCPSPTSGNGYTEDGSVICLAGFIPTTFSEAPFGIIFLGDDRDFSSSSHTDQSRFWIWIDVASGEIINSYIHPTIAVNDVVLARLDGGPWGQCTGTVCTYATLPDSINQITSSLAEDGTIHITYSVLCSHPICLGGPGPDGWVDFIPDGEGGFRTRGSVERFPNLEAYHWKNGQLQSTLFQYQFFSSAERALGVASIDTAAWMYGGLGQLHYWNTPSPYPHISLPQGGVNPLNIWNPLFQ